MRVVIVADASKQRLALADTIHKLGLDVADSLNSAQLLHGDVPRADVWLVDVDDYDAILEGKIASTKPKSIVMGFASAPYMRHDGDFVRWQNNLMRRLRPILFADDDIVDCPAEDDKNTKSKTSSELPWRFVLFLGASMGGVEAVKEFLDCISPKLPLAVLIAQHFDERMIDELPKVLTRHNQWRCRVLRTNQSLRSGMCLIAPIDRRIICDGNGRIQLTKQAWTGEYKPSISAILQNTSEVLGSQLIGIIFSGMGDDGSSCAKEILVNGSILWAQDPSTCKSPSQPQNFINTGVCQFVGSPKALAERVNKLFTSYYLQSIAADTDEVY